MTDHTASQRDRIGEVADSFVARFRAGERPSIEEYARKYPHLADELRQLLPALVILEQHGSLEDAAGLGGATAPRPAPRELGDFTIVREIGRGGMGVVYEAVQQSLGRHVALKVLSSGGLMNPVHLERFRLEARSAGRLHHSHIVPVFGVGEHQGLHYYAMQFIAGQSLDQVIEALRKLRPGQDVDKTAPLVQDEFTESLTNGLLTGRFRTVEAAVGNGAASPAEAESKSDVSDRAAPPATPQPTNSSFASHSEFTSSSSGRPFYDSVARVGLQVAEALAYAHAEGVLHRDIKPSNLLLDAKGNTWVTDFGLAKAEENEALTETGDFVGTLRYMAPERLEGWSDRRSDIYGLGATLYELLTLRPFFESANRAQLIDDIRHAPPRPPTKIDAAIPRDLETIVLNALAKEPASRYHTAEEMAEDLRRLLADRPILARRSTTRERFVRWCRRNPMVASLTATVALALIVGTIVSTWQAVRAKRAENLAQARLQTETIARHDADRARKAETEQRTIAEAQRAEAETQRTEADKQRATAEENYRHARETVYKYFTEVSESVLLDVPRLQPLRKQLLDSAAKFYEDSAVRRGDDPAVLADLAASYMQLSQIHLALGQIDDCVTAIQKGLDVVAQLHEHPQAAEHERRLAGFWNGLRPQQMDAKSRNPFALHTVVRLETAWTMLAEEYPSQARFRSDLAMIKYWIAKVLRDPGQFDEALPRTRAAHLLCEQLVREQPSEPVFREAYFRISLYLAERIQATSSDEALALARQATQAADELAADFPESAPYRFGLAECVSVFGRMLRLKQLPDAEPTLRRGIELAESVLRDFPGYPPAEAAWQEVGAQWVQFEASIGKYQDVVELTDRLTKSMTAQAEIDPKCWARKLVAFMHHEIGNELLWTRNDPVAAEPHERFALSIFEAIPLPVDSGDTLRNLVEIAMRTGRLNEARQHADKAAEAFGILGLKYEPALLYLRTEQTEKYRRLCQDALDRDGNTNDVRIAFEISIWCKLGPDAVSDYTPVLRLIEMVVKERGDRWCRGDQAHLFYRSNQVELAAKQLEELVATDEITSIHKPINKLYLAMAYHRLGNHASAERCLHEAGEWIDKNGQQALRDPWHWRLEMELLRAEAEELLGIARHNAPKVTTHAGSVKPQG